MTNFPLSENFSFFDLCPTNTSLLEVNKQEALDYVIPLKILADTLLEPAADILKTKITVTSGFRGGSLNKILKGSPRSQHTLGEAADIVAANLTAAQVFEALRAARLPYGQLILEEENGVTWVHISLGYPFRNLNKSLESFTLKQGIVGDYVKENNYDSFQKNFRR
ncbi:hypothetical protein AAIR98_001600 [Elusimicrobium simillimum]|uniref:D-Ala-D-Ala carboxypeptidase family metallohydrolase n=1 Tax=Elusimicrobium simillimum TaxID=3143438 RepID=UPI003C6FE672